MSLKKSLLLLTAVILIIVLAVPLYIHIGKQKSYDATLEYLTVYQEYDKSDIKSITVEHTPSALFQQHKDEWTIKVVFKDEPKARYFYKLSRGEIIQIGWSGRTENDLYKHSESVKCGE